MAWRTRPSHLCASDPACIALAVFCAPNPTAGSCDADLQFRVLMYVHVADTLRETSRLTPTSSASCVSCSCLFSCRGRGSRQRTHRTHPRTPRPRSHCHAGPFLTVALRCSCCLLGVCVCDAAALVRRDFFLVGLLPQWLVRRPTRAQGEQRRHQRPQDSPFRPVPVGRIGPLCDCSGWS